MRREKKKESFFTKCVNFILSLLLACLIGSQVCTAANNNLRIAQVSDAHFSSYEKNTSYKFLEKSGDLLDDVIMQINTSGPYDFVIFTGDLINHPKVSELDKFLTHTKKLVYPWYAVDGNHDISIDGDLDKSKFIGMLSDSSSKVNSKKIYYAFTPKKGYRVLCLDSIIDNKITTNGRISDDELLWIKDELKAHPKDTVIVATHVPVIEPYSSPSHRLENEYELRKLLKAHTNPVIVLQGHYHAARIKQDGNMLVISSPSLVTYPNAYRVVNINTRKNCVKVDVFLKETNLKDIQSRSQLRLMGTQLLYGEESDRNESFELRREK
ncbi:metallophosphoesterase [bacterium]|nr:metallophosphoesterase [bacterium]